MKIETHGENGINMTFKSQHGPSRYSNIDFCCVTFIQAREKQ